MQGGRLKGRSSHDLLNDRTLSSVPAVDADDEDEPSFIEQVELALDTLLHTGWLGGVVVRASDS